MPKNCLLALILALLPLSAISEPLSAGQFAPGIDLPNMPNNGHNTSLASLQGQVVYVDFWASWCGPCRISFPLLNDMRNQLHEQGFEVLAVNVDEFEKDALAFLEELPVDYAVVRDSEGVSPASFGVLGMPTGFLIDREGRIREVHQGFRKSDADRIREAATSLLAERTP
jgi:thiol-disulfide isomerase/thioredoxin